MIPLLIVLAAILRAEEPSNATVVEPILSLVAALVKLSANFNALATLVPAAALAKPAATPLAPKAATPPTPIDKPIATISGIEFRAIAPKSSSVNLSNQLPIPPVLLAYSQPSISCNILLPPAMFKKLSTDLAAPLIKLSVHV